MRYRPAMALVNLADYEAHAREAISGSVLDYYDGGANDEFTLRDNPAAFSRIPLYLRVFRGTARREVVEAGGFIVGGGVVDPGPR
jgi:hypothetical protein